MRTIQKIIGLTLLMSLAKPSLAQVQASPDVPTKAQPQAGAGIAVDESNFKAIFSESVTDVSDSLNRESNSFNLEVRASYSTFSSMELSNNFFTVDYAEEISSIPSVQFSGSKKFSFASFGLEPTLSAGYGTREALISVRSRQNNKLKDYVSVHWLPMSAGVRASHPIPGLRFMTAFLTPAVGAQYIYQSGKLDGIDQGFWIPFASFRGGLSLFESDPRSRKSSAWLDGVALSGTLIRGLSSSNQMSAWSVDLGLRVLL
jgi:hypothetical protein